MKVGTIAARYDRPSEPSMGRAKIESARIDSARDRAQFLLSCRPQSGNLWVLTRKPPDLGTPRLRETKKNPGAKADGLWSWFVWDGGISKLLTQPLPTVPFLFEND